jgi:hypothetical protein
MNGSQENQKSESALSVSRPIGIKTSKLNRKYFTSDGYVLIYMPDHPFCSKRGYIQEHILIIENVLGKYLDKKHIPHHINEVKSDNRNNNLVICESRAYHNLLHMRMKAYKACGHANWRKCNFCKQYDDPKNLYISPRGNNVWHNDCVRKYQRFKFVVPVNQPEPLQVLFYNHIWIV